MLYLPPSPLSLPPLSPSLPPLSPSLPSLPPLSPSPLSLPPSSIPPSPLSLPSSKGLNDLDVEGDWLVQRQALWVPPQEVQERFRPDIPHTGPDWSYSHADGYQQCVYTFRLEECALVGLLNSSILCSDYNIYVPLSHLVPDLLLTDLPPHLMVDKSQLLFNPKDTSTRLGRGGAGENIAVCVHVQYNVHLQLYM